MSIDPEIQTQENATVVREELPAEEQTPGNADRSLAQENEAAPQANLVAVAFRSAFWTVVAGILLCACILTFSPYTAMRFYTKLDLKDMALYSAEKYLRWHSDQLDTENDVYPQANSKYADALYCAVNNSVYLMNKYTGAGKYSSKKATYYAKRVDRYAGNYLLCSIPISLYDRTVKIDTYALQHTSPALHPNVYSYTDRLNVEQFKAWYVLGDHDRMLARVQAATTRWAQEDWQVSEADFLLLAQLSAYIDAELDNLGLGEIIASKPEGKLMWDDIPTGALLYGEDKPFDLFVYDRTDVDADGKHPVEQGQFTRLYYVVSQTELEDGAGIRNNYREKFVAYLRDNIRTYAKNGPTPDRAEHLKYTYYLKTFTDFYRSMYNMCMLLDGQSAYFPYAEQLHNARQFWEESEGIPDVYYYRDGYEAGGSITPGGIPVYTWYRQGALTDYLAFYGIYA